MSITSTEWAVVAASVSASVFSIGGAFWLDAKRAKRQARITKQDELKSACARIISGSMRVAHKAGGLRLAMVVRSGLTEGLNVLLRLRKPVDPLELNDYLFSELAAILDAQSVVWLSDDTTLIRSAGDVVMAVADVINKSTSLPKDRHLDSSATQYDQLKVALRRLTPLRFNSEEELVRQSSVKRLGLACAQFGEVVRERLGMKDIDAILKAFPGLLEAEIADAVNPDSVSENTI